MAKTKKPKLPESWEEFCDMTGRDPNNLPQISNCDEREKNRMIAAHKLPLIINHCNGRELDYTNSDEWKYEIWWEVIADKDHKSGLGLSCHGCAYWDTGTDCGPRFAFTSVVIAKHVAEFFKQLFEDLYL